MSSTQRYNARHQMPKPDMVNMDDLYSFSYNPEVQPEQDSLGRVHYNVYSRFEKRIEKTLRKLLYCDFKLFMDISQNGRLHYHGYIRIRDRINFYFHDIPIMKRNSSFEIDTIGDVVLWDQYCQKMPDMVTWCNKNDLKYIRETDNFKIKNLTTDLIEKLQEKIFKEITISKNDISNY